MNIFALSDSPIESAHQLCDKHIVKMPLETAQMLCSVWHRYGHGDDVPYKEAHKNHPCTLWAGDFIRNYIWLWEHGMELCFEYTRRYGKTHKCQQVIMNLNIDKLLNKMSSHPHFCRDGLDITAHPQCMPDEYKFEGQAWIAYRNYYVGEKADIAKWEKSRPAPNWFNILS